MLSGFNHVAILTDDLDRLEAFYRDVLGVTDTFDLSAEHLRHRLFRVGAQSVLHAFEQEAPAPAPIFERGRLDHLALNVGDVDEFDRLRERLVDAGASDGEVTDFGSLVSVGFQDPDGLSCELCYFRDGATLADTIDPW